MPRSGPGLVTIAPLENTLPSVGFTIPDMVFIRVDLPQPEWPIRETISPFLMFNEIFFTAVYFPVGVLKLTVTLFISILLLTL